MMGWNGASSSGKSLWPQNRVADPCAAFLLKVDPRRPDAQRSDIHYGKQRRASRLPALQAALRGLDPRRRFRERACTHRSVGRVIPHALVACGLERAFRRLVLEIFLGGDRIAEALGQLDTGGLARRYGW
jgi:hypothetical protein